MEIVLLYLIRTGDDIAHFVIARSDPEYSGERRGNLIGHDKQVKLSKVINKIATLRPDSDQDSARDDKKIPRLNKSTAKQTVPFYFLIDCFTDPNPARFYSC